MIFITDTPIEIKIKDITFKVRPLSGADVIRILGKNGFEKFATIKGEEANEILEASVIEFTYEGKKYGPEYLKKLRTDIYTELLGEVINLNFGDETNFQKKNE